jgi:transcriptional regulator of arginine metabolism
MNKIQRQNKILKLVRSEHIASQVDLGRRLRDEGIQVTQATLSRDLRDLSLLKTPQGYRLPEALNHSSGNHSPFHLRQTLAQFMTEVAAAHNMVVVKTHPGNASSLALSLDNMGWKDIVGTVAGDDTILVVTRDAARARALKRRLMELAAQ